MLRYSRVNWSWGFCFKRASHSAINSLRVRRFWRKEASTAALLASSRLGKASSVSLRRVALPAKEASSEGEALRPTAGGWIFGGRWTPATSAELRGFLGCTTGFICTGGG